MIEHTSHRLTQIASLFAACAELSACGGSGSDADDAAPLETAQTTTSWSTIANEGQTFEVVGTKRVRFGAQGKWVSTRVSGTGKCDTAFFGSDPAHPLTPMPLL